jgi:bacterioferritin
MKRPSTRVEGVEGLFPPRREELWDGMDKQEFVTLLNEDLGTEYQSIVQYVQHVATIKGAEYQSTVEELRKHLGQELNHATTLAEQIDFLGGVPTVEVPKVPDAADDVAALELDLQLEEGQLERYRQRVLQAVELGLPDVAEALRPLLQQTQDHVIDLRTALGK